MENRRVDTLSRRSSYIEIKKKFNTSILKTNKHDLLLANEHKLNITLRILKDNKKQFLVKKGKL